MTGERHCARGRKREHRWMRFAEIIESTSWNTLEHAYGAAEDTAELLVELATTHSRKLRAEILENLYASIAHQGSRYSATAPTVSALAALLDERPDIAVDVL